MVQVKTLTGGNEKNGPDVKVIQGGKAHKTACVLQGDLPPNSICYQTWFHMSNDGSCTQNGEMIWHKIRFTKCERPI